MTINEAAQILGIQVNATAAQLRTAYRKLAKKWHPDAHPNDPHALDMMQKINEANAVFQQHLQNNNANQENNSGQRPNADSGPRPNTGSGPRSGQEKPRDNVYDRMLSILKDLWNRYEKAKIDYEAHRLKLQKAYDEKELWQGKASLQRKIYNQNPTIENYTKLVDVLLKANKAEIDHRTAKYQLEMAKLLRDSLYKQYQITYSDWEQHNKQKDR